MSKLKKTYLLGSLFFLLHAILCLGIGKKGSGKLFDIAKWKLTFVKKEPTDLQTQKLCYGAGSVDLCISALLFLFGIAND